MHRHIKTLSVAFLFYGGFLLLDSLSDFFDFSQIKHSILNDYQQVHLASFSFAGFDPIIKIFIFLKAYYAVLIGIPALAGGWGLYCHKAWGRYVLLTLSLIVILNFPIGTIIGLYGIWALTKTETVKIIHTQQA